MRNQKFLLFISLLMGLAAASFADQPSAENARAAVDKFLASHNVNLDGGWMQEMKELADPALEKTFPARRFFLLRFRQYPVARMSPPPLQSNNIFAVDGELRATLIMDADALLKLFRAEAPKNAKIKTAMAWATLCKELEEDGMFHLQVIADGIEVKKTDAGECVTVPVVPAGRGGNAGSLELSLIFDAGGNIVTHQIANKLQAGPRPICQSMRLNHPDRAVREEAERQLLVMGRDALPYLHSRLGIVKPALKEKIQAVIDKIKSTPEDK